MTCAPIVICGVSEVSGSWKIMVMREPRSRLSFTCGRPSSSWLRKITLPVARPFDASRPVAARKSWLLPEPDSPTTPRHSPADTLSEIFFTACTSPSLVAKRTSRSLDLENRRSHGLTVLGVEGIPEPIADEVEAEQGHRHEQRRENQRPGGGFHLVRAVMDQHAPRRQRLLHAETEERQEAFGDNHGRGSSASHRPSPVPRHWE